MGQVLERRAFRVPAALLAGVLAAAFSYFVLSAPFQYILHPRFGTITYAVAIHGWRDLRVSAVEVLLMQAILVTVLAFRGRRAFRLAAYCALAVSAFNVSLPIVIDYGVNLSSQSPFPGFWMRAASDAYQLMVSQRLLVDLPNETAIWLASATLAFAYTRAGRGLLTALLDSCCFAFVVLSAFSIGSHVVDPAWATSYVTLLQAGTSFQWFTNDDLLVASLTGLAVLSGAAVLLRSKPFRGA